MIMHNLMMIIYQYSPIILNIIYRMLLNAPRIRMQKAAW